MECTLEIENAKMLDKILNQFYCTNITIQTTSNALVLQIIQEDNSLFANINLKMDFFVSYECTKPQIQNMAKIKFYKRKSSKVKLKLTEYAFSLVWEHDFYKHKKEIYISDSDLYKLEFTSYEYSYVDSALFYDLLKYFDCKNIEMIYNGNYIQLESKEKKIESSCKINIETGIYDRFEIPAGNLRRIFSLFELSEKFCIGVSDTRETINVLIEDSNISISIFLAAYT